MAITFSHVNQSKCFSRFNKELNVVVNLCFDFRIEQIFFVKHGKYQLGSTAFTSLLDNGGDVCSTLGGRVPAFPQDRRPCYLKNTTLQFCSRHNWLVQTKRVKKTNSYSWFC